MAQYQPLKDSVLHSTLLQFLDNSAECIVCLDLDYKLTYCNNSSREILKRHLSDGSEIGSDFLEVLKKENLGFSKAWLESLKKVTQNKGVDNFEVSYNSNQGFSHLVVRIEAIIVESEHLGFIARMDNDSEPFLRLRLEKLLNDFKSTLLSTSNEEDLLWSITENILSQLFLEDAIIFMKSGKSLKSKAVFGTKLKAKRKIDSDLSIEIGQGIVGSVAESKIGEFVNDITTDSRYFKDHFEASSEIALPIISLDNELLGVINCESKSKNFFRKFHLEILSNVAEVTAQKIDQIRKVDQLRISKEYNKAVLNSTPTSYLLFGKDKTILSLNKLAKEALPSYSGSPVKIGSSFKSVIQKKYQEEFCELFDACIKGRMIQLEKKISEPEEEECWIKFIFSPAVNSEEEIFGVTLNIQNISSDKLAQTLMQERNESLEIANKELDKVIYSVSHDLRAPVSNVIGLSSLIDYETSLKEIKEYNSLIQSSMRRMDNFIKNVLAFSKNSKVEPHYQIEDVADLLDGIIQDHSYMKGIGDIQFEMNIECKKIITDQQRLSVILSNLISNAIKYHDAEKEMQWIKLSCSCDEMNIIFTVEDNGQGIEEENLSQLFNMYYMVNSMDRSSGIGLYILKDTLKLMHGNIEAKSKVGEGSCFTILLPIVSQEAIVLQED